jgi:hypothetical protein
MVKISEDRCKGSDDLFVWMGIVFSWRLRVYAMNLRKHWMDLLRGRTTRRLFDRWSGRWALARVTNYLPANSRRRLHFPKSLHLTSPHLSARVITVLSQ